MLTDDTLRKVRETARIDEVASGYLTLHRSGKDFVALCPFHDERASLLPRLPGEEHREVLQLRRGGGPDTARVPHGGMRLRGGSTPTGTQIQYRGGRDRCRWS